MDPSGYNYEVMSSPYLTQLKNSHIGGGFWYRGEYLKYSGGSYYSLRTGINYGGAKGDPAGGFFLQINTWATFDGFMSAFCILKWVPFAMSMNNAAQGGNIYATMPYTGPEYIGGYGPIAIGPGGVLNALRAFIVVAIGTYTGVKAIIDNLNSDRRAARDWEKKQRGILNERLRKIPLKHSESVNNSGYNSNIGDPSGMPPFLPPGATELWVSLKLLELYLNCDKATKPEKLYPSINP